MPDVVQTIRSFVVDHILEPDAMRGTEHYLKDSKVVDEEQDRRNAHAEAIASKGPVRLTSGGTQTPALDVAPSMVDNAAAEQWARDNGWSAPDHSSKVDAQRESNEVRSPEQLKFNSDAPDKTRYSADAQPVDRDRPEYASGNLSPNTPNPTPVTPPPPAEAF